MQYVSVAGWRFSECHIYGVEYLQTSYVRYKLVREKSPHHSEEHITTGRLVHKWVEERIDNVSASSGRQYTLTNPK